MKQGIAKSVFGWWTISDRVMVVKLKAATANLNIQAYVLYSKRRFFRREIMITSSGCFH